MKALFSMLVIFVTATLIVSSDEPNSVESRRTLQKTVDDYIALYRKETLDQWKALFHPSVVVAFPAEDGGITIRNLEEFFKRQKNYFSTRKSISERLERVQIFEGRRLARVVADFVFIDEGEERPGKLGLHLVENKEGWKIVAVLFSYDSPLGK